MAHQHINLLFKHNKCSDRHTGVMALASSQVLWLKQSWTPRMAGREKTLRRYYKTKYSFLTGKRSRMLSLSPSSACSEMKSCPLAKHQTTNPHGILSNWLKQQPKVLKAAKSNTFSRISKRVKKETDQTLVGYIIPSNKSNNSRIKWCGKILLIKTLLLLLLFKSQINRVKSQFTKAVK